MSDSVSPQPNPNIPLNPSGKPDTRFKPGYHSPTQFKPGHPRAGQSGRRRIYADTPEDIERFLTAGDEYFDSHLEAGTPVSIAGLALHLGLTMYNWSDYYHRHPQYRDAMEWLYSRYESYHEENLLTARNPTGSIFALKNRRKSDWQDEKTIKNENPALPAGGISKNLIELFKMGFEAGRSLSEFTENRQLTTPDKVDAIDVTPLKETSDGEPR